MVTGLELYNLETKRSCYKYIQLQSLLHTCIKKINHYDQLSWFACVSIQQGGSDVMSVPKMSTPILSTPILSTHNVYYAKMFNPKMSIIKMVGFDKFYCYKG